MSRQRKQVISLLDLDDKCEASDEQGGLDKLSAQVMVFIETLDYCEC